MRVFPEKQSKTPTSIIWNHFYNTGSIDYDGFHIITRLHRLALDVVRLCCLIYYFKGKIKAHIYDPSR